MSNRWLYRLRRWPFLIRGIIRFLLWLRGKPVPYLFIENFEAGLDTRKSRFTAPPGSLRQCVNAHITRGKEIEKRKAFVEVGTMDARLEGLLGIGGQLFSFGGEGDSYDDLPPGMQAILLDFGGLNIIQGGAVYSVEAFAGKSYVVARSALGGKIRHFYDGQEVADWTDIATTLGSIETVARFLAWELAASARYSISRQGAVITLRSRFFELDNEFTNRIVIEWGEGTLLTLTLIQAGAESTPPTAAAGGFTVSSGTTDPGVNQVTSVLVDGFDVIGSSVDYDGDNVTTAQNIVDAINSAGLYTASRSGSQVVITAEAALGSAANGRAVEVDVAGDVSVSSVQNLSGGSDEAEGQRGVWEIEVVAYDATGRYEVRIEESAITGRDVSAEVEGLSSAMPLSVKMLDQKMYAITGTLTYFSGFRGGYDGANQTPALPDPTAWQNSDNETDEYVIGAGVINLAERAPGGEDAVGLAVYQNRLAVFSRRNVQIWSVDPDPDLNRLDQVLLNIGAVSSRGIIEYGDTDVFFLSETGVRSLRARDSSNLASTTDVGDPVDTEITRYMRTLPPGVVARSVAVIEPTDGRYLLALGKRVYVFSNFPGARVSAWSRYDLTDPVRYWATADGRLYYQPDIEGDTPLYLYGGEDGETYDSSPVTVELPFLEAGNPAGRKKMTGIDLGVEGTWEVEFASEPNDPDARELIGTVTESTYGSFQQVRANALSTHFSLYLTNEDEGPAVLANAILHYDDIKAD